MTTWRQIGGGLRSLWQAAVLFLLFITATAAAPLSDALEREAGASPDLAKIYAATGYSLLWHGDAEGAARRASLLRQFEARSLRGLTPDASCTNAFKAPGNAEQAVRADIALTSCFLMYRRTLAGGAVDTAALGANWNLTSAGLELSAADLAALRRGDVAAILDAAEPQYRAYQALRAASAAYQAIAARGGWPSVPGPAEVLLDGSDARVWAVRDRLAAEGYLPSAPDLDAVKVAVADFQARHGLAVDGRVGQQTLTALNIPVSERIATIAVNLERWRHVPRYFGRTHIAVNVADASLALIQEESVTAHMLAIVGDPKHQTPLFRAEIGAVTLNPSWTIPKSIAAREILPKLRRDPLYLQKNDTIILNRDSDPHGRQVDWRRISAAHFPFQLRQRPGSKNPLGLIKFEMANGFDVYLDDTPARTLFARPRRGLSHGCIRVEQPATLAQRLLPDWNEADIQAVIASGETRSIPLPQKLPVYLLYWTAFVDDADQLHFRDDLYGQDGAIAVALGLSVPPPKGPAQMVASADCVAPM